MIDITLYGKQSSIYQYLKMHVKNLAEKAGVDLSIKEVNDTDAFIEEDIMSIPTVKVGNEYRSIGKKNVNRFINEVNEWVLGKEDFGNLKKIYVPIDFSDASVNAVRYAKDMAEFSSGVISLVYSYYPTPVSMNEVTYIDPEIEKIQRENLKKFKQQISTEGYFDSPNSLIIDSEFLTGFPVPELVNLSKRNENMLMVMGAKGKSNMKKLFGSVSTDVAIKSACPVLLVPDGTKFNPFRKIVFCSNDLGIDAYAVEELIKVAAPYNADIEVIHVDQKDGYHENQLMNLITNYYPKGKVSYKLIKGDSKLEAILGHVTKNNSDLLVMSRASKGLIRDLFHKSLTKQLIANTKTPLLITHK